MYVHVLICRPSQYGSILFPAKVSANFSEHQKNGIFRDLQLQGKNPPGKFPGGNQVDDSRSVCKTLGLRAVSRKITMPLLDPDDGLYKRLSFLGDPNLSAISVLEQWIDEGRRVKIRDLQLFVKKLRKFRRYTHALQVSEWMASRTDYQSSPADCAVRLDLIAKVHGIQSAEKYFDGLPDTEKNNLTYGALLNVYAKESLAEKAEAIMEKLERSGYTPKTLNYNAMMNLYRNTCQFEKVPLVMQEMRKKGVPPDEYSYNICITAYAAMSDMDKMEQVMEEVNNDNTVNMNWAIYSTLANMYIKAGLVDKATSALDEVRKKMHQMDRSAYEYLISLYACIGNKDEVYKTWRSLQSAFPKILNRTYIVMLSSLVKLGDIEGAEEIFKKWESSFASYDVRVANIFLGVYVRQGLLEKAEFLFQRILERGGKPNIHTWEILAEGYIQDGKFDKVVTAMKNSALIGKGFQWQPKPANVRAILSYFEKNGDVERAEEFFEMLRDLNSVDREMYNSLLRTYIEAGKTDPGILEHMKKDKVNPNEETEMLLRQVSK